MTWLVSHVSKCNHSLLTRAGLSIWMSYNNTQEASYSVTEAAVVKCCTHKDSKEIPEIETHRDCCIRHVRDFNFHGNQRSCNQLLRQLNMVECAFTHHIAW